MEHVSGNRVPQSRMDHIANRAVELLKTSPDSKREMEWAENKLEEQGLWSGLANRQHPGSWAQEVIAQNPAMSDILPYLQEKNIQPETSPDFQSLLNSLIPSEGGQ